MDLSKIKPVERAIEIVHPRSQQPIGLRLMLLSIDDDKMLAIKRRITDERLRLEARGKNFKTTDLEENQIKLNMTAIADWEWYNPTGNEGDKGYDPAEMPDFNGTIPDFTPKNVRDVLTSIPWINKQVSKDISDAESFFDVSATN